MSKSSVTTSHLPQIGVQQFTVTIPSTGKKFRFRPFLVKEEKILLMAIEGKDDKEIVEASKQIIQNCCIDTSKKMNVSKLPTFDVEYIFLKLRSKSVGEKIEMKLKHQKCGKITDVSFNIDDVEVVKHPDHTTKIQLTDAVGVIMRYPTFDALGELGLVGGSAEAAAKSPDLMIAVLATCIEKIYDNDSVYASKDLANGEMEEWILGLQQKHFAKIQSFFETMPKLKHDITFTCNDCKEDDTVTLEGLQSFFT